MHSLCIALTLLGLVARGWATTCPDHCTCTDTVAQCSGGAIPTALPITITSLALRDANPPMFRLTSNSTMKLKHLEELELVSVGLSKLGSGALGSIDSLTTLTVMHNNLPKLSKAVFINCHVLKNVTLDNNNIMVIEEDTFSELVNLQHLSLKRNVIFDLPAQLPTSLVSLNAEFNPMSDLPKMVLPNLKKLNICNNHFYSIEAKKIQLENLEELCIGSPGFQMKGKFINSKKFPQLKKLEVHGTDEGTLEIKGRAMKAIADMAERQLETLYMENCTIYPYQGGKISLLVNLLENRNSKLKDIRLIGINPSEPSPSVTPKTRQSIDIPSVAVMDISGSPFLARALLNLPAESQLSGLQKLLMANCEVEKFPPYMQERFPNLGHLDLSNNPLSCDYEGFSWIYKNSESGKLILLEPQHTVCAAPDQFTDTPLLDAMKHLATTTTTSSTSTTTTTTTATTTTPKPTTSTTSAPVTTFSIPSTTYVETTTVPSTTTPDPTTTPEPVPTEPETLPPVVVTVSVTTKLPSTTSSTTVSSTTTPEPTTTPVPTTTEQDTLPPVVVTVPVTTRFPSTTSSTTTTISTTTTTTQAPVQTPRTELEPEINTTEIYEPSPIITEITTEHEISSTTKSMIMKLTPSTEATTDEIINSEVFEKESTILENAAESSTLLVHTSESLSADRMLNDQSPLTESERSGMSNLTLYLIIVAISLIVMVFLALLTLRIYHRCHSDSFILNGDDKLLASHENGNSETVVIMNRMPLKSNGHIDDL